MKRLLGILVWLALAGRAARAQTVESFRFIHVTDTHLTATQNVEPIRHLVQEINGMMPRPDFVVDTGDITESGRQAEFDRFKEATSGLPIPFYAVPGNHDVRWAPLGKEAFTQNFQRLYQSFDHGGCHFVLLDSTVLLEHWGHFDSAELRWLEADLKKQPNGTPVLLFFHHWIGRENPMIDNEEQFLRLIAPYNVKAMFIGHGHSDIQWKVNGIQCVMARGLYQGSYHVVDVSPLSIRILRVRKEQPGNQALIAEVPLAARPFRRVAFTWDDANISLLARRTFVAQLMAGRMPETKDVTSEYSVDDAPYARMAPDDRIEPHQKGMTQGRFVGRFETKGLVSGSHVLHVRMTGQDGVVYTRAEPFSVEQLSGQPREEWRFATGDAIQSSPTLANGTLYATSLDGKLYALDPAAGKRHWATLTHGPILSTPLVSGEAVYVGSMDHNLYALDARTGQPRWHFDAGTPLFATPAVSNGIVCIGADRKIYGLDERTGERRWTQDAGSFFQSRAAVADGVFYLGGWDNTLYALDAATGTPRWTARMGRTNGGRGELLFYYSPAIASPAVGGGRVYVCTDDGVLHAVSAATGRDDWIARAPTGGDGFGYSSPLYLDGRIYVGGLGSHGDCYAFDSQGNLLWRCSTGFENYDSSPAPAGSLIAIGSVRGKLSWIDPATGALRYQYGIEPGHCFSTPVSDGKRTYIADMNNGVYCLSTP